MADVQVDESKDDLQLKDSLHLLRDEEIVASALSGDKESRSTLLAASRQLTAALEEPDDRLNYAQFWVSNKTHLRASIFTSKLYSTFLP
jgi:hypothetical protein